MSGYGTWGLWFRGNYGGAGLVVGLDDPEDLFQLHYSYLKLCLASTTKCETYT